MEPTRFEVVLGEAVKSCGEPPNDPLGELSSLEMAIWRSCYHHNRQVHFRVAGHPLQVGDKVLTLELEPDFQPLLKRFPVALAAFCSGKPWVMDFPESGVTFKFMPHESQVAFLCNLFGYHIGSVEFCLNMQNVTEQWTNFFSDIVAAAQTLEFFPASLVSQWKAGIDNDDHSSTSPHTM